MQQQSNPPPEQRITLKNSSFSFSPIVGAFSLTQLTEFPYNFLIILIPIIIIQAVLIVFYLGKINKKHSPAQPTLAKSATETQTPQNAVELKPQPKPKIKSIPVGKGEVAGDMVKFSIKKGLFKKRWVAIKEIPLVEIVAVESLGKELTLTWKDQTVSFELKRKGASFVALRDQIRGLLEEQQKTREANMRAAMRKSDLTAAMNLSLGVVDSSFDILIGLQVKPIDWARLEKHIGSLGQGATFAGQMLAPLTLDFSKMIEAVKAKAPKDASREIFSLLKLVYGYFEGLTLDEPEDKGSLFKNANDTMVAYYMLNDLLLAKAIGEKDSNKENSALETLLANLADETNVKINVEAIRGSFNQFDGDDCDVESIIAEVRENFREPFKQF